MNSATLMRGIRDGNYHAGGIRCLRLHRLDEAFFIQLRDEVIRLTESERGSDVTHPTHVTHWTRPSGEVSQFSLFNISGRYDDYSGDHDLSVGGKRFHGAASYPNLACLLGGIPDLTNFRINLMGPGSSLSAHEEHTIVRIANAVVVRARFHLPVTTDVRAELILDGHVFHLAPAVIYFVNHGCIHSARNGGESTRVHLVWDVLLTREAYAVLFGAAMWPVPSRPVDDHQQVLAPVRVEEVGAYEQIPPHVTRDEADGLTLYSRERLYAPERRRQ
jgi:hypothetical protein